MFINNTSYVYIGYHDLIMCPFTNYMFIQQILLGNICIQILFTIVIRGNIIFKATQNMACGAHSSRYPSQLSMNGDLHVNQCIVCSNIIYHVFFIYWLHTG